MKSILQPIFYGIVASLLLLALYFGLLTLISGWSFAQSQFASFAPYIVSLVVGFGIQIALVSFLKARVHDGQGTAGAIGVSGTTSTVAMISCCAHYLVNLVPVLGATGLVTFVAQYQIELFWIGILSNLGGIIYIGRRIWQFERLNKIVPRETTQSQAAPSTTI